MIKSLGDTEVQDTTKTTEPEKAPEKSAAGEQRDSGPSVEEIVKSAVADAMKEQEAAAQKRETELRAEIAKLRETAIPGGPFFTAPPGRKPLADQVAKAAEFERLASAPNLDRGLVAYYTAEARRLRAEAA
jgi:hypothetical protein